MFRPLALRCDAPELLESIASLPDENNESGNQSSHDKHPALDLKTQQVKM
jgi:hypothetical protein